MKASHKESLPSLPTSSVPGTTLRASDMCVLFLKPANNFHSHPHFTEEETESVGSEMMYSANYSIKIAFECGDF